MDLSLDEIIKKKKIGSKPIKKKLINKKTTKIIKRTSPRIQDARFKIIQRNRAKIRDAREKLVQITKSNGDARLKILRKRKNFTPRTTRITRGFKSKPFHINTRAMEYIPPKYSQIIEIPRGYIDYDNMEVEEEYHFPAPASLRRTVHNDKMPQYDSYRSQEFGSMNAWNNDPFDCYEAPVTRPIELTEPIKIRREIREMSPDIIPRGILRSKPEKNSLFSRRQKPEQGSHLSYEMRSRLEHAPNPHASMGIFANPQSHQNQNSSSGYRIVVSNLHNSVTQNDIKELFEDIGELYEARLVRPGVAEVIFRTIKDAEKAVDTYHNRQLDGQPMKCLLVKPRASNKPTSPAIKGSTNFNTRSPNKTPLEIDIDALHKVLFRRQ